jgi:hypothetical protein
LNLKHAPNPGSAAPSCDLTLHKGHARSIPKVKPAQDRHGIALACAHMNGSTRSLAQRLDGMNAWRASLDAAVAELAQHLGGQGLLDEHASEQLERLRQRLAGDKLTVAFVAEFSRGKSELINAMFFSDTGRRVLPATPGRTTMCPVEMSYDKGEPAMLSLLPIETRIEGRSLADLRLRRSIWTHVSLDDLSHEELALTLMEVTRTRAVSVDEARKLGLWSDDAGANDKSSPSPDNPPLREDGLVDVPAWRHALIKYPHPLLEQGLVVLDTPGLNAVGAEPELTLSVIPSAHAVVFILGADTGVTRSDMNVWREHLNEGAMARFVVLNKIDTLMDPLLPLDVVQAQIRKQCANTARTLGIEMERVFPLSARQALTARLRGDDKGLETSRLPALETMLAKALLPQRSELLAKAVQDTVQGVQNHVQRQLTLRRRHNTEQALELRGLRGKNAATVRALRERVDADGQRFELCSQRMQALKAIHNRSLKELLDGLAGERVREQVRQMQLGMDASFFHVGARKVFLSMCRELHQLLTQAQSRVDEMHGMLHTSSQMLNTDYGFALAMQPAPDFSRCARELELIERSYSQYLGIKSALRLLQPDFMEQFRRMLLSKLRAVFDAARADVERWSKSSTEQIDAQLRERRDAFVRRREALVRIEGEAGELEARLSQLMALEQRLGLAQVRLQPVVAMVMAAVQSMPARRDDEGGDTELPGFAHSEFDSSWAQVAAE